MTTVTSFTAARMLAIENAAIVDGEIVGDNLILQRFDETTIDAGNVRGPTGSPGVSEAEHEALLAAIGVYVDWTPEITDGLGVISYGGAGNAQKGRYTRIGDTILGECLIVFGFGGSVGGASGWQLNPPVPALDDPTWTDSGRFIAQGHIYDASDSGRLYPIVSGNFGGLYRENTNVKSVSRTNPITNAQFDTLYLKYNYEAEPLP